MRALLDILIGAGAMILEHVLGLRSGEKIDAEAARDAERKAYLNKYRKTKQ